MGQRAPTLGQIAIAVAFAFSCFGLLLFLWTTFGGPVPLKPEGYRFKVPFSEATTLAEESDVRISGVSVGRVKEIELADEGENRDLAVATIEIDDSYAPLPDDTRATLRLKTLLGETYVELSQGDKTGGTVEEGGSIPAAQVSDTVQLDEIVRTFDAPTRAAFQTWMQQAAIATLGRGADLNATIGNLEPFAEEANRLVRILDSQEEAVSLFVKNTGVVFDALSERKGQLQGLIANSGTVFATTARRDQDLREAFIALPTFLDESRLTLERLETFSADTNPLITQLHPSAKELSGTLKQVARISPDLRGFFVGFRKLARRSKKGLPALQTVLSTDLPPLLTQLNPFLRQLTPVVATINRYRSDVTGFLGNITGATQARARVAESNFQDIHYLRTAGLLSPEAVAFYPNRLTTNRSNPYMEPLGALKVGGGLEQFNNRACGTGITATLDPSTPNNPFFQTRATQSPSPPATDLFDRLKKYAFNDQLNTALVNAPPCKQQGPLQSIGEIPETTTYLHVYQDNP